MGECHHIEKMMWEHSWRNGNCVGVGRKVRLENPQNYNSSPLLPNTHAHTHSRAIFESQTHARVILLQITHVHGSATGPSFSPRHTMPTPLPPAVSGHLLCAAHCSEHFVSINLFNPQINMTRLVLLPSQLYR